MHAIIGMTAKDLPFLIQQTLRRRTRNSIANPSPFAMLSNSPFDALEFALHSAPHS